MTIFIKHDELNNLLFDLKERIINEVDLDYSFNIFIYGIPKNGTIVAGLLLPYSPRFQITYDPSEAHVIIDDLVDSGATKSQYEKILEKVPFLTLIDKKDYPGWVVFPWEVDQERDLEGDITRLLQHIGEDPKRGGLIETPKRVAKAWKHWSSGYGANIGSILKVFEDGAENYDQMITVKEIPFYSNCEHHMAPFFGTVTISYIPNGKIVGLSKLSRLVQAFALRLQVQERLTNQIADAIQKHLNPIGVGVSIKARHLCMESRGICQQGHHTVTTALIGEMKTNSQTRQEFMDTVKQ